MSRQTESSIASRVQNLDLSKQCLVLGRLVEARTKSRRFAPADMTAVFDDLGLPRPSRMSNAFLALERLGLFSRTNGKGAVWRLTPRGRESSGRLVGDMDLRQLAAEAHEDRAPQLGEAAHPLIPPALAPPELLGPLTTFLRDHPFEANVFGMTRFPDEQDDEGTDPISNALETAKAVCSDYGLDFHLASDGALSDDLWTNVAGFMWASRYGIGFFENRRGKGLNYNLTVEIGGMLMSGRRCALLRDSSIEGMPTDLVGRIYKPVDLDDADSVQQALVSWIEKDLGLSKP